MPRGFLTNFPPYSYYKLVTQTYAHTRNVLTVVFILVHIKNTRNLNVNTFFSRSVAEYRQWEGEQRLFRQTEETRKQTEF
jgi:hypothetical protein